jgi:hydrogenase-4 component F
VTGTTVDLLCLVILLAPTLGGLMAWRSGPALARRASFASASLGGAAALAMAWLAFAAGPQVALGDTVRVDALGGWLLLVIVAVTAIGLAAIPRHLAGELDVRAIEASDVGRFYAMFLWFIASLWAVPLWDNLGLVWVAVEAATAVSTLLVGFARTPAALEAAWKYLVLGTVGIGFALLATLLLYAAAVPAIGEHADALNWSRLVASGGSLDPGLVRFAFLLALAGYGTKVGLAPFHTWLPDAHSQAPSPVSAVLSGAALAVALYALVRVHLIVAATLGPGFSSTLLVAFGLVSMAVALPFLIAQGDLKRLLAYSSVEHMGLLALGIGFGGPLALVGATVHVLAHALTKAVAFVSAGDLVQQYGSHRLGEIRSSLVLAPAAGPGVLVASMLAAGLPPSAVFVAEFAIILGGIQAGWTAAAIAAAGLLAVGFAAIAFHVLPLGWGRARRRVGHVPVTLAQRALVVVPLGVVAALGLWTPAPLVSAIDAVVGVLSGTRG